MDMAWTRLEGLFGELPDNLINLRDPTRITSLATAQRPLLCAVAVLFYRWVPVGTSGAFG